MSISRTVLWLVSAETVPYQKKANLLRSKGFNIKFATSMDDLRRETSDTKIGFVFVADTGEDSSVTQRVIGSQQLRETRNARFILTTERPRPQLLELAAAFCFRDLIPMELPDQQWIDRVVFSCSGQQAVYHRPTGHITMNNTSQVHFPARLIWATPTQVRVECAVFAEPGTRLGLSDGLARKAGIPQLNVIVEEGHREFLRYRFSSALVCRWETPGKLEGIAHVLGPKSLAHKYRIYIIAKSLDLRNALLSRFHRPEYEINLAMHLSSIAEETRFFSPRLVIVEACFALDQHDRQLLELLKVLPATTTVVITGADADQVKIEGKSQHPHMHVYKEIPEAFFIDVVGQSLVQPQDAEDGAPTDACHFDTTDPLSFAKISIPARLTSLHPLSLECHLPFGIKKYGVGQLHSPVVRKMLGKDPWIKFSAISEHPGEKNPQFRFIGEGFFLDLNQKEIGSFARAICQLITNHLRKLEGPAITTMAKAAAARTPELGSLKDVGSVSMPTVAIPQQEQGEGVDQDFSAPTDELQGDDDIIIPIRSREQTPGEMLSDLIRSDSMRLAAIVAFAVVAILTLIALVVPKIAQDHEKSGRVYTEQLEKFAAPKQ